MMPHERYQDVKVGDLIILSKDNYGAIRYFGEIQIVTWVPDELGRKDKSYIYADRTIGSRFIRLSKARLGKFVSVSSMF